MGVKNSLQVIRSTLVYQVVRSQVDGIRNAVELNPEAMVEHEYRAPGNTRVGGPFASTGSYGNGCIIPSVVWLRYYVPDKETGPLAGVPLPKAHLELSTGEKFWLKCDFSLAASRQNTWAPGRELAPLEPIPGLGPELGWFKMFGIWLVVAEATGYLSSEPWGTDPKETMAKVVRDSQKGHFLRGPDMPWCPMSIEQMARCLFGKAVTGNCSESRKATPFPLSGKDLRRAFQS